MAKKPKAPEPPGESAPMWIVSFADLVTLMMSFFVVLYALKQGGAEQQIQTAAAIKYQFGYTPSLDSDSPLDMAVFRLMGKPRPPSTNIKGNATETPDSPKGPNDSVEMIREGKPVSGGLIHFAAGSAELNDEAQAKLKRISEILRGHFNVLIIKGHVSDDEVAQRPDDPNGMNLSYRRAMVVADQLVKLGLDRRVMRPTACGPFEPLKTQVYNDDGLKTNRRVEIYTTESTLGEFTTDTEVHVPDEPGVPTMPAATTPEPQ